jgi:DNA helicase-2/ATP-dependent DNA helicase PcrA
VLLGLLELLQGVLSKHEESSPLVLLDALLATSGYKDYVLDGTDEGQERWENIQELRTVAQQYASEAPPDALTSFLEDVALVSDVDNLSEEGDAATLLTLHMAKGLEFDTVLMVGLEEGILPHSRSLEEPEEMEEERRLCYVGMTRAKRRLYLIHTFRRARFGNQGPSEPSRFLRDIPSRLVKGREVRAPARLKDESHPKAQAPAPAASSGYRPGDRVRHPQFGEGMVVSSQKRGGDEEVTVVFVGKAGIKRLMAGFAGLKRVGRPE